MLNLVGVEARIQSPMKAPPYSLAIGVWLPVVFQGTLSTDDQIAYIWSTSLRASASCVPHLEASYVGVIAWTFEYRLKFLLFPSVRSNSPHIIMHHSAQSSGCASCHKGVRQGPGMFTHCFHSQIISKSPNKTNSTGMFIQTCHKQTQSSEISYVLVERIHLI